tara:strand:+ start:605 stop:2239 length:1635 start_codon:yes stop_codon:yes gene_type:complete
MILKNSLIYVNQFFFFIFSEARKFYLKSYIYNKKISKINSNHLEYKPSPSLLDSIIKYSKNKKDIKEFYLTNIWSNKKIKKKDFKKLHNFFWLFTLDLNSSKKEVQSVLQNWFTENQNYNSKSWDTDILSKRVISLISNTKITYEGSSENYKNEFDYLIKKQINHLINEIDRSKKVDDKIIGCAAIILGGLSFNDKSKYLNYGLNLLKKIINTTFDNEGFPKSRNIRQLNFYLKYFILIREWLKESQNEIPEYLDEIIFHLGQAYTVINQGLDITFFFNGNQISNNSDFDNHIKRLGYQFKNEGFEVGNYIFLKDRKLFLAMDLGSSPEKKFSENYQAGVLSFELINNGKKIVSNSGYFQNYKHQLNLISKSTACHSTLVLNNSSSTKFLKNSDGTSHVNSKINIINKKVDLKKKHWVISAEHDGYLRRYGAIHSRKIEYFGDLYKFIGTDKIIRKKKSKELNFEIRFHLDPGAKVMKTQDKKTIYIEFNNEGWKFKSSEYNINYETGLYFGKKNNFLENQNIVISGIIKDENQEMIWEVEKMA